MPLAQVFLFEYGGPFLIHPLMYFFSPLYYALWGFDAAAVPAEKHWVQTLAMWMCVAHYGKRLLETLFVHRFSNVRFLFGFMPCLVCVCVCLNVGGGYPSAVVGFLF